VSNAERLAFRQGYYLAVATLVRQHDASTEAVDLLNEFGAVNFRGIDAFDVEVLRPIASEITRKRKAKR
jgi:hypothetical protein